MKEFELGDYARKYHHTVTVLRTKTGKLLSKFIGDVMVNEDNEVLFRVDGEWVKGEPEYFRFEPRIYKVGNSYMTLKRRLRKSYKIGLCDENHEIITLSGRPQWMSLDAFSPLILDVPKALADKGPISDRIFITPSSVIYQGVEVGVRKGSKFLVTSAIEQEVHDALRGFECKISS